MKVLKRVWIGAAVVVLISLVAFVINIIGWQADYDDLEWWV